MDSFMHNHQSALDSFMEDKAIQDLEDAGIYPDPDEENYPPETVEKTWCIYSHLTNEEKTTVDKIVSTCLERNGFAPEDNWWEMNYLLPSEDLNDS